MPARRLEDAKRAVHVGPEISFRFLDRGDDVGARGEVEDAIAASSRRHNGRVGNIGFDEAKARIAVMLLEISEPSDSQVIEDADRTALSEEAIDEMTADKTGATRHQINPRRHRHLAIPPRRHARSPYAYENHQFQVAESGPNDWRQTPGGVPSGRRAPLRHALTLPFDKSRSIDATIKLPPPFRLRNHV